jgi:hypothetical protein
MKNLLKLALLLILVRASAFPQTVQAAPTPAPVVASKPIDYQALCLKLWPSWNITSGMAEFPHSTAIFFWVVDGSHSRSDFRSTKEQAWQDAYLRNRPARKPK